MSQNTPDQYGQQENQPAYGAGQAYPSEQNGNTAGPGAPQENPGRTLGIVGLICSIILPISLIGLIISIVAMLKSKKARMSNGLALAGIIVGAVMTLVGIGLIILLFVGIGAATDVIEFCQTAGPGVQEYQGQQINCSDFLDQ